MEGEARPAAPPGGGHRRRPARRRRPAGPARRGPPLLRGPPGASPSPGGMSDRHPIAHRQEGDDDEGRERGGLVDAFFCCIFFEKIRGEGNFECNFSFFVGMKVRKYAGSNMRRCYLRVERAEGIY